MASTEEQHQSDTADCAPADKVQINHIMLAYGRLQMMYEYEHNDYLMTL